MPSTTRGRAAITGIVVGLILLAVGVVGLVDHWGNSTTAGRSPISTQGPSNASIETPQGFLKKLASALRSNNVAFLVARLNPAVIHRYGERQCRSYLPSIADPTVQLTVQQLGRPTNFEWTTDGESSTIARTQSVIVTFVAHGSATTQTVHITLVDRHYTWFTDCGTPKQ